MSDEDPWAARRGITFAQAEGAERLPEQLALRTVSEELRALIWAVLVDEIEPGRTPMGGPPPIADDNWNAILRNKWIFKDHKRADHYSNNHRDRMNELYVELWTDDYVRFFGLLQWLLTRRVPERFRRRLRQALEQGRSAYRMVSDDLIAPLRNENEAAAFRSALEAATKAGLVGATTHLRDAALAATAGSWAASVRDSIHAIESIAVRLVPGSTELGPALRALEQGGHIHGAMKSAFSALYGYASDEEGVRHALVFAGAADVDEADAIFMLGACASFASYLIARGSSAGLL